MHFNDSSFIAEQNGEIAGFLIGFMSQTAKESGYIHLAGVNPDVRKAGVGRQLYEHFFECFLANGRPCAEDCTAAINELSIAFHQGLGFEIEPGDDTINGFPVTTDYFGPGDSKVLFKKVLKR